MPSDKNTAKMFTRGGQITFNNLRMLAQVNTKIMHWVLGCLCLVFIGWLWVFTTYETLIATYYYVTAIVLSKFDINHHVFNFVWHGQTIHISVNGVLLEPYFMNQVKEFGSLCLKSLYASLAVMSVMTIFVIRWLVKRGKVQADKSYIRGSRIESPKDVATEIKAIGASDIKIENVPMIKGFEVKHILIHGTTGAGKGQTFNQFLEQIRKRGDSAIIFDKGCVFTSLFYDESTDIILNPFDKRCVNWDLWANATTEPDFENIAESLIPKHGDSDPYWVDAARTVFSACAFRLKNDKNRSIDKLLSLILTEKLEVLGDFLKGTPAATLVSGKIEKTAISIRSVLSTYLKSLRFLQGLEDKPAFSIRDWVNEISTCKKSNFMFISSNAEHHASQRSLISMWLSMASISLLSLQEDYNRRIWFICDELPTLHKLPLLGETIAEVRKFGGCFVLGMQSFAQLQKVYGKAAASEIFDLLNTRFFFRSPSADMASLVSKELGQEEVEQTNESYSYGANTVRDGISIGTQRVTRPLISQSEIMELPDLTAYLRVPAKIPITMLNVSYRYRSKKTEGFIFRDMVDIDPMPLESSDDAESINLDQPTVGDSTGDEIFIRHKQGSSLAQVECSSDYFNPAENLNILEDNIIEPEAMIK